MWQDTFVNWGMKPEDIDTAKAVMLLALLVCVGLWYIVYGPKPPLDDNWPY